MNSRLQREIRQRRPFRSLHEEAFLNLQRTANFQLQALSRFLGPFDVTPTQYNTLRILRGSHPDRLPCKEVGRRMVTPLPDVTRLLNRLAARALIERSVDSRDRRVVLAGITAPGLALLAEIDRPLDRFLIELLADLENGELVELVRMLEIGRLHAE